MAGFEPGHRLALVVAALQAVVYLACHRRLSHFPTQVRTAYLLWLAASFVPALEILLWMQAAGTTALIAFGYCPLARTLLLLPHNRKFALTPSRVLRILLHPPTDGSVLDELRW